MIEIILFVSSIISFGVAAWMYKDNILLTKYLIESTEEKIRLMDELILLHQEIIDMQNTYYKSDELE